MVQVKVLFDLPEVPRAGEYISILRPDKEPFSEDAIVRQVWWRLRHPEVRGVVSAGSEKIGNVIEIFVECEPALGPWSSDNWRRSLRPAKEGDVVPAFDVLRLSVRESDLDPSKR